MRCTCYRFASNSMHPPLSLSPSLFFPSQSSASFFSSFFSPLLAFLFFFSFRLFQRTPSNGQGLFSSLMRFESTTKRFTRNGNFFPFRIFQAQSSKMSQFFDRIPFVNAFVRNEIVIRRRFDGLANIFVDELNESLDWLSFIERKKKFGLFSTLYCVEKD